MAVLTNQEITDIWRHGWQKGQKEVIKADGVSLDKTIRRAILQAIEDDFNSGVVALKGLIDTAAGTPMSVASAKKFVRMWMAWKVGEL